MALRNQLSLLGYTAQAGLAVGADALGDLTGRSFPYAPARITSPAMLTEILQKYALAEQATSASILAVEPLPIPSASSNCNNLVVRLTQADGEHRLPDTLFIKLPDPALATRWFFALIESWRLETWFFTHVAQTLPIRTPTTYAAHAQGTRFCLIQEDLNADPSVQLFTNFDMLEGPSLAQVHRCLDTFARLHSAHATFSEAQRLTLLPLDHHPFLGPRMGVVSQALDRAALKPCRRKAPGIISDAQAQLYRRTLDHWDALLEYWFSGPLSLCHGDSHLGNFFACGDEMGMLDFQAAHWGKGIRDVQYFLIDSLPSDFLAANERALVDYYVERRAAYGSAVERLETWQLYRSFTFHSWMTIVVSIGLAAMNPEQDGLMRNLLSRTVDAIERTDYSGWLAEFLARQN